MTKVKVPGILLLYHHPLSANAPTVMEHVESFQKYSRHCVISINTELGFPKILREYDFSMIVLHYSLFGEYPFKLNEAFIEFVKNSTGAYKIAFFQDEYRYCQERFRFIDRIGIKGIYSLLRPEFHFEVYLKNCSCDFVKETLAGYVDTSLIKVAKEHLKASEERDIYVGYRARDLPYFMGAGAQEKTYIAKEFFARMKDLNHILDIDTSEEGRIYGRNWYKFLSRCIGTLGVEAGVSVFDLDGSVFCKSEQFLKQNPAASFSDFGNSVLAPYENKIHYRMISPRIFEAAAFRTCMILFEGDYNGVIIPMRHYIPLKKDFSNFDWVMKQFNNSQVRYNLISNAYSDLILSKRYSYEEFIKDFDRDAAKISQLYTPPQEGFNGVQIIKRKIDSEKKKLLRKAKFWQKIKKMVSRSLTKNSGLRSSYNFLKRIWLMN